MTRMLVAYATRMGSTREIAAAIGEELTKTGITADVREAASVRDVSGYDAVVVGSALYMGRWRRPAVRLLSRSVDELRRRPTWLFQSGPCGEGAQSSQVAPPRAVQRLATRIGADVPVTFGGRITPETAKGFIARKMASGDLAGDFRDWDRIRDWARDIATHVSAPTP